MRTSLLRRFVCFLILAAVFVLQLHELTHLKHARSADGLKTSCEICDVRSHTPLSTPDEAIELPIFDSHLHYIVLPTPALLEAWPYRLQYSRGPPARV